MDDKGILTYLTREIDDKQLVDSTELEDRMKEYLGKDSFGDVAAYMAENKSPLHDDTQYRNVPKLDFSEIRRPVFYPEALSDTWSFRKK